MNSLPESVVRALRWIPHAWRATIATTATAVQTANGRRSLRSSAPSRRIVASLRQREEPLFEARAFRGDRLRKDAAAPKPLVDLPARRCGHEDHVRRFQSDRICTEQSDGLV